MGRFSRRYLGTRGVKGCHYRLRSLFVHGIAMRFPDRIRAGQLLAEKLSSYRNRNDVAVVALPPGGVPVGYEIANALNAPFDVLVIRHLCVPENPLLVMGAVSADGTHILNQEVIRWLNIRDETINTARWQSVRQSQSALHDEDAKRLQPCGSWKRLKSRRLPGSPLYRQL